jgi:phage I-like protein
MTRRTYQSMTELPAWGTAKVPPTEFQLWGYGEIRATMVGGQRETVYLTQANAQAIEAEWSRRQIRGSFDYHHEFAKSAGWFDIEARSDGLWVVGIEWTPTMLAHFARREYRYCSPAFVIAMADGQKQITELTNVAITNYPATDRQRPLIALSRVRRSYSMTPEQAKTLAAQIIDACKGDSSLVDSVALLLMADAPAAEEAPADPAMEAEAAAVQEVVATARTLTGLEAPRQIVGALKQLSVVASERDQAVKELTQLKHHAAVEQAIRDRKLSPAKREEALKVDPQEFAGAMRFASLIVDDAVLTPKTKAEAATDPKAAINEDMRRYCAKTGTDVEAFAAQWVAKFGAETFRAK